MLPCYPKRSVRSHAPRAKLPSTVPKGAVKPPPLKSLVLKACLLTSDMTDKQKKYNGFFFPPFGLTFFFFFFEVVCVDLTEQLQIPISLARMRALTEKECAVWLRVVPPVNNYQQLHLKIFSRENS